MNTKPLNDTILVELDIKKYGEFSSSVPQEQCETGTVIAVSDKIHFYSSFSWVLENSQNSTAELEKLRLFFVGLVGKKVRWEERADRGTSFEKDGKKYAVIKMSKVLAVEEE